MIASLVPNGTINISPLSSLHRSSPPFSLSPTNHPQRRIRKKRTTMAALATSLAPTRDLHLLSLSGCPLKPLEQSLVNCTPVNLSLRHIRHKKADIATYKSRVIVRAGYRDGGRPSSANIFVGGFVLGGIIVGTLGCVYAPQISKVLAGADRKDLMRKLPKFIYDEEKALEKTRKILGEKIAQLNSAIDDVSSQLRTDDGPNGVAVSSDEVEAAI